jgi:N-acetylmuramic acid 6-phosphate (MurNAc-6-P) etherase
MVPVDVLVKFSASGTVPDVVLALNWATGALYGMVALASLEKPLSVCDALYAVAAKW